MKNEAAEARISGLINEQSHLTINLNENKTLKE
jgi:hypothetical protein